MEQTRLEEILRDVKSGRLEVEEALALLKHLPYQDLGFAKLDHHRLLRRGLPEVVYCRRKTPEQVVAILRELSRCHKPVLATKAAPALARRVLREIPEARYFAEARLLVVSDDEPKPRWGEVAVVTAGTADIPVAEEAALTAIFLGNRVKRLYDVGVAGVHRLLANLPGLEESLVLIVVAGMDGVLPSLVGGLVDKPVIAVPTSTGYGANFAGLAPLLTMLNTCAPGVGVVNIDNGFGAAVLAHMITRLSGQNGGRSRSPL